MNHSRDHGADKHTDLLESRCEHVFPLGFEPVVAEDQEPGFREAPVRSRRSAGLSLRFKPRLLGTRSDEVVNAIEEARDDDPVEFVPLVVRSDLKFEEALHDLRDNAKFAIAFCRPLSSADLVALSGR